MMRVMMVLLLVVMTASARTTMMIIVAMTMIMCIRVNVEPVMLLIMTVLIGLCLLIRGINTLVFAAVSLASAASCGVTSKAPVVHATTIQLSLSSHTPHPGYKP